MSLLIRKKMLLKQLYQLIWKHLMYPLHSSSPPNGAMVTVQLCESFNYNAYFPHTDITKYIHRIPLAVYYKHET